MNSSGRPKMTSFNKRDSAQFETLFKQNFNTLYLYALKFIPDEEVAKDIVQDAFYYLWNKRQQIEIETSVYSYLCAAVRNGCYNHLKHIKIKDKHKNYVANKLRAAELDYFSGVNSAKSILELELEDKINKIIDSLPEQCKKVFLLSRYENLKNYEVAEKLGISVKAVEKHISKALKIFRQGLKDYLPIFLLFFLISG